MLVAGLDVETFASVDLPEVGLWRYVEDPTFEVLMVAWRCPYTGEMLQLDYLNRDSVVEAQFIKMLTDPNVKKTAWNAQFEFVCLRTWYPDLDLDIAQFECSMLRAKMCGLPARLVDAALALDLPKDQQKMTTGRSLIGLFCGPVKPTKTNGQRIRNLPHHLPEQWTLFLDYNRQDVVTEESIVTALEGAPLDNRQFKFWSQYDFTINDRGVGVDIEMAEQAIAMSLAHKEMCMARSMELTQLENPNSLTQLKKWLNDETGELVGSLSKQTLPSYIRDAPTEKVAEVLKLRGELSLSSVKKYFAIDRSVCSVGRIKGMHEMYGANRTGRWTMRLVQLHNLKKNGKNFDIGLARRLIKAGDTETIEFLWGPGSVPSVLSEAIRSVFIPAPGKVFIPVDFSAVEARAMAWAAWVPWRMEVFNGDGKIYERAANQMFGIPLDEITKAHPARQASKIAELACGYQGSVDALIRMDAQERAKNPELRPLKAEELPGIVEAWRKANPEIASFDREDPGLWVRMENAAVNCVRTGREQWVAMGDPENPRPIRFELVGNGRYKWLVMWLQSGRPLLYFSPTLEIEVKKTKAGKTYEKHGVTYMGMDDQGRWVRVPTYGGKLCENWSQAFCRDLLLRLIVACEDHEIPISFHVHDEVVPEVQEAVAQVRLEQVEEFASTTPAWAPGLPLKGAGTVQHYYFKED